MASERISAAAAIRRAASMIGTLGWPALSPWDALHTIERKMPKADPQIGVMWQVCVREAVRRRRDYSGLHPVIEIHVQDGQTKEGIIEYMLDCADLAEAHPLNGVEDDAPPPPT